jgi:hypothetical protein
VEQRPDTTARQRLALHALRLDGTDFWSKVEPTGFCWNWTNAPNHNGYGQYGSQGMRPHRIAYELLVGPIPDGLTLDHLCRNKLCVNPDHVEPVTRGENARRGNLGRRTSLCKRGHPKTITRKGGYLTCRVCVNHHAREGYRAR